MPIVNVDVDLDDVSIDDLMDNLAERLEDLDISSLTKYEEKSFQNLVRVLRLNIQVSGTPENLRDYFKNEFLNELSSKYTEMSLRAMEAAYKK